MKFMRAYNKAISTPSGRSITKQNTHKNKTVFVPKELTANRKRRAAEQTAKHHYHADNKEKRGSEIKIWD